MILVWNLKPKAPNASSETEEPQPGGPNPSPERVERHPENAGLPPPEKTNSNHLIRERGPTSIMLLLGVLSTFVTALRLFKTGT